MKRILLLLLVLSTSFDLTAQNNEILYLDFNPDSTVYYPIEKLYIDFDQDGESDAYLYTHVTSGGWWFDCYSLSDWELCCCKDTVAPIQEFDDNWGVGFNLLPPEQYERFAVRRLTNNGYYYGWMEVSYGVYWWEDKNRDHESGWHSKGYLVLDKQCYCSIPDYPLRWGQTSLNSAIGENGEPTDIATVQPNPGNGQVRIEAPTEDCVVRFYDLNGRLILAKPFDFATDVDTDHWTPGLYLWEIWNGTQHQASGKWVKE